MFRKYEFFTGLFVALLSAGWLIYLANASLDVRSAQRGSVAIAAILFCIGILLILHEAIPNPRLEKRKKDEDTLRDQILVALSKTSMTTDDLNDYVRNVTGKPGLRVLNRTELERIEDHVLASCREEADPK